MLHEDFVEFFLSTHGMVEGAQSSERDMDNFSLAFDVRSWGKKTSKAVCRFFEVCTRPEDRHIGSIRGLFGDAVILCVMNKGSFAKR